MNHYNRFRNMQNYFFNVAPHYGFFYVMGITNIRKQPGPVQLRVSVSHTDICSLRINKQDDYASVVRIFYYTCYLYYSDALEQILVFL